MPKTVTIGRRNQQPPPYQSLHKSCPLRLPFLCNPLEFLLREQESFDRCWEGRPLALFVGSAELQDVSLFTYTKKHAKQVHHEVSSSFGLPEAFWLPSPRCSPLRLFQSITTRLRNPNDYYCRELFQNIRKNLHRMGPELDLSGKTIPLLTSHFRSSSFSGQTTQASWTASCGFV